MGRETKLTFLQRKYPRSQQVHEKVFNITIHRGNGNQNHNDMTSHMLVWPPARRQKNKCWQDCGEKGALVHAGGNINWCCSSGKQYGVIRKLKTELPGKKKGIIT